MATNNRSGSRGSNGGRRGQNNNPKGRNQYSGVVGTALENPLATAAVAGGALAAGLFLWSRRNQISDQIGDLADQIGKWRGGMASGADLTAGEISLGEGAMASQGSRRSGRGRRSQTEISEEALTLKETGETA